MATKAKDGWVTKKLLDPEFREGFETEYEKLSIGEQIAKLRISAKLTQEELAQKIGTTASAICRYENAGYDRYESPRGRSPRRLAPKHFGGLQTRSLQVFAVAL